MNNADFHDNNDSLALVFESVHQVMMAEDLLNDENIICDLIPIPREISSQCGLAMVLSKSDIPFAMSLIKKSDAVIVAKYFIMCGEFIKADDDQTK